MVRTAEQWAESYREVVEEDLINIVVVQDDDCRHDEVWVMGSFNPYFEGESISKPIRVEIVCNTRDAVLNLTSEQVDRFDFEFIRVVSHEMVHLDQYREGRFILNWEGEYEDNPNEIEAYEKEYKGGLNGL